MGAVKDLQGRSPGVTGNPRVGKFRVVPVVASNHCEESCVVGKVVHTSLRGGKIVESANVENGVLLRERSAVFGSFLTKQKERDGMGVSRSVNARLDRR